MSMRKHWDRITITLCRMIMFGVHAFCKPPIIAMLWLVTTTTAEGAVTAFIKAGGAGVTCANGTNSANFSTGGPPVQILVCISAPVESLCGITYRLQAVSGEGGLFNILSRAATTAFGALDGPLTFAPLPIGNPPAGISLGGGTSSNLPVLPAINQLVATLAISPTVNAINAAYVLSLDPASVVGIDDGTGDCSAPVDQSITASVTLNRASPPEITSADSATITVGFPAGFTVAATGTPLPTLSMSGALPAGVTFSTATGLLSGVPSLGTVNSYPLVITAINGNLPNATQNFTLTVQKANQALNFGVLTDRTYNASPFSVAATANSGLPVSFSSSTTTTCLVSGTSVTMLTTGTCTIVASNSGNADYNPAAVSRSFQITGPGPHTVAPSASPNGAINPALPVTVNNGATTTFTVAPNLGYSAVVGGTCGGSLVGNTFTTNPITENCTVVATFTVNSYLVNGVANPVAGGAVSCASPANHGSTTSCTVTSNSGYTLTSISGCGGTPGTTSPYTTGTITSACTVVADFAGSTSLVSVVSRKVHGGLGPFEVALNPLFAIGDAIPVEPRSIGAGHLIVFTFNGAITDAGSVTVVDTLGAPVGSAALLRSGNEVHVALTGVPDNKRVRIALSGVNGSMNASASIGFLVGDISGSHSVNASDISTVKAHLNQTTGAANFLADTNADGVINAKDLSALKARSGLVLP